MIKSQPITYLSKESLDDLFVVESTYDENERKRAISRLATRAKKDECRVLIELFEKTQWRETKKCLLSAIGLSAQRRGVEFLIRFIATSEDYGLSSEAILALGDSQSGDSLEFASEFLKSLLKIEDFPLKKEVILALSQIENVELAEELYEILLNFEDDYLHQYALLALSQKGDSRHEDLVIKVLQKNPEPALRNAALVALGKIGGVRSQRYLMGERFRFQLFAHELKNLSLDNIKHRLQKSAEGVKSTSQNHIELHLKNNAEGELLKIFQRVKAPVFFEIFSERFPPSSNKIEWINAYVTQVMMNFCDKNFVSQQGYALFVMFPQLTDNLVKLRVLRALGQIKFQGEEFLSFLREKIKSGNADIYAVIKILQSSKVLPDILDRLKVLVSHVTPQSVPDELIKLLTSLHFEDENLGLSLLEKLPLTYLEDNVQIILKILGEVEIKGLTSFVESCLRQPRFQDLIMAIAACRKHLSPRISELLFGYLEHPNEAIAQRALDSLCLNGKSQDHLKLLGWANTKSKLQKILLSITPKKGSDYTAFIQNLDTRLQETEGFFAEADIISSAISLRDQIYVQMIQPTASHSFDVQIQKELPSFSKYSPVIKSVLRNAELTWCHPKLFDDNVDRSTIIIELTKSIDLYLQETLGAALFAPQNHPIYAKLQSRVLELSLDEGSKSAYHLIQVLNCESHFSADEFPAHKMSLLCDAVATGRFKRDYHKIMDGLRAWGLVFLLFARHFQSSKKDIKPVLPLKKNHDAYIKTLAQELNHLQEIRNRAVHRGIQFTKQELEEIRGVCFHLLNELPQLM